MPTARPSSGEQPESRRKWSEGNRRWISRVWQVHRGAGDAYIPTLNESTVDGYFQRYEIRPGPAQYDTLVLDFVDALSGAIARADADSRWTLTAATELVPLEEKGAAYRMKWNHNLYVPATEYTGYSQPGWWATAATPADANGIDYLWAKDDPGDAWAKVENKTKPGVEGYLVARPVARYEYWNATKATAVAQLKTVATLQTPAETFGYSGGTWLVTYSDTTEDAGKWRAVVEFTYDPNTWDTDLYS